uniref:RNB domain-containing protein n=1 Tax=viral metagenome TaxID=1070528 RepID=A0A6C0H5K8_9ZZZZ
MLYKVNIINYKKNEYNIEPELGKKEISLFEKKIIDCDNIIINKKGEVEKYENGEMVKNVVGILKCKKEYGKMEYMFEPYDKKMPPMMVKYREKIEFNKEKVNRYCIIKWIHWKEKYPKGELIHMIGKTNVLKNYYEYQLYAKELMVYGYKNKYKLLEKITVEGVNKKYSFLEKREDRNIFSIDPKGSRDYDDALSIKSDNNGGYIISVYITNVALWLEYLNHWKINGVSSIYLPNMVKNMLPKEISEKICSLCVDELPKITYGIDINIKNRIIKKIEWKECIIKMTHNFVYEEKELMEFEDYKLICKESEREIKDSHELVEYYMTMMSKWTGKEKLGIIYKEIREKSFLELLIGNEFGRGYTTDETMGYLHITSPIRRVVDLINNMYNNRKNIVSEDGKRMYEYWINNVEKINEMTKRIKKVERQGYLLEYFERNEKRIFEGILIEKTKPGIKYRVYLYEINSTCDGIGDPKNEKGEYEIYLLKNEENEKKKIRCKEIIKE